MQDNDSHDIVHMLQQISQHLDQRDDMLQQALDILKDHENRIRVMEQNQATVTASIVAIKWVFPLVVTVATLVLSIVIVIVHPLPPST